MSVNVKQWDAFINEQPHAHALQLSAWGALKAAFGWSVERVTLERDGKIIGGAQILFRPLPLKLGTVAYIPMGVYAPPGRESDLWKAIHATAKKRRARFLKWEPGIYEGYRQPPDPAALGFLPSPQTIQPPRTVLIDVSDDDETILSRMNQGTRRKIRQSLKKDVRYYEGTVDDIEPFSAMMQTTGQRNEFGVHTAAYYRKAFELFAPENAALFMAEHEGDLLAGIMVFAAGGGAWYLYGASSNDKRNLMATYGVQWQAIQWARARRCTYYDLWGVPDEDEATLEAQFESRNDGLWGVYGFKRGWGGRVVRSLGTWDYVYSPLIYRLYQTASRLRG